METGGGHVSAFPSWVYVNSDRRPKSLTGSVLATHTAGTDLFGVHDTYDLNIDVKPTPAYEKLLSTRNADESPPQIHTEWESGLAPLFAWPSVGDTVRETGSEIWDCGHWQTGSRKVPDSDFVPGDPLGAAGVEAIGGEEIEIHPMMELATWRAHGDFVPRGLDTAVRASQLDVAISNQGGKAKSVEECALLAPKHPGRRAAELVAGIGCSPLQTVTGRDYTYELTPPGPRPSAQSKLVVEQMFRYAHHGPRASAVKVKITNDKARITVPFSKVRRSSSLQDFGATFHAYWSDDATATHTFRVAVKSVTINNNLDADSGDNATNPSITPEGEWNMFVALGDAWINLHDPRAGHTDLIPELGAVPSAKAAPIVLPASAVPAQAVRLGEGDSLHLFTDARECDQPGYIDCPTRNELATTGKSAGRSELSLPVAQLLGKSTTVTIHPPVCATGASCPEDKNPVSLCPQACYAVTFTIDDVATVPGADAIPLVVTGDGTPGGTRVNGALASTQPWWIAPVTRYGPSQGEENVMIAGLLGGLLTRR